MLGWLLLSVSAIDGILGTEYHHLLSVHTTIEKVLAGLVFAAAVLVIGIVCCQALKSQMRRVERVQVVLQLLLAILCMAYVVLAAVFGIIPMVPLGMAIVIAPPTVALTSMLEQQLHNLARGLNMKKRSSSMKGGKFSFKTFKDWLQQGAPESMASMDLDVNEEILEQGLATAPIRGRPRMTNYAQRSAFLGSKSALPPMSACPMLRRSARAPAPKIMFPASQAGIRTPEPATWSTQFEAWTKKSPWCPCIARNLLISSMILELWHSLLAQVFSDVFSEFHLHQSSPHKFIGFSSSAGAIPPMAEMQAMWWCRLLEDKVKDSLGTAWSPICLWQKIGFWDVLGCFGMFWVPKICSYCQ